jgi:hypothetical protein
MKSWLLAAFSVCLCLVAAEVGLRATDFNQSYWWNSRYGFFSAGALVQPAPAVLVHAPKTRIRHAAVYDVGGPELEYDYSYTTNNLGLAQSKDVTCGKPSVVAIGDSFLEGQGSPPWFVRLEETWPADAPQLANLGFFGTGMLNWQAMLAHWAPCLRPAKLLIVFISNDWYRPVFAFPQSQIDCLDGKRECREPADHWHAVVPADTGEKLVGETRARAAARWADRSWLRRTALRAEEVLKRDVFVFALVRNLAASLIGPERYRADRAAEQFARSEAAFRAMVDTVGRANVTLVHVSQRDEAVVGGVGPQSRRVLGWLGENGFDVRQCPLAFGDFMRYDGHPTPKGYEKLAACVGPIARELAARTGG